MARIAHPAAAGRKASRARIRPGAVIRADRRARPRSPHSADSARPELDADPRTGRAGGLGYGVLPGALAAAAHHEEIAMAEVVADGRAAAARAQQQRAGRAHRDNRDHGVRGPAAPDGVTVPRDAVPAVPVQAQAGGPEWLAPDRRGDRLPRAAYLHWRRGRRR